MSGAREIALTVRRMSAIWASQGPSRPAKGRFPYSGRTVAEVIAEEERAARKRNPCDHCFRIGRCEREKCPVRDAA